MRAYVLTTGALFFFLTIVHVWRMFEERHLWSDPWYVAITVATAVLGTWAVVVLRRHRRDS